MGSISEQMVVVVTRFITAQYSIRQVEVGTVASQLLYELKMVQFSTGIMLGLWRAQSWNNWQTIIEQWSNIRLLRSTTLWWSINRKCLNVNYSRGNYGSQVIAGQSAVDLPYTLQDTNHRPVLAVTGRYPVIHSNHTVASNCKSWTNDAIDL